ncbi:LRRC48 protein (macronuclear) [Tetrahymena thermophila SB210]|uniref:Dynein regulatory complex subunit 3 n=1 Tax=Tetrahymena thermophila (strain SB210) TaxID=312017 RepID=I7MG46_TETTS|nr:LRRC48 protein [Tetrahymena thermophila SB210]EAS01084.2 LRRC48 protein [Tetrahymena thermophila SB210]8TH8_C Chain C, LRRC48 protein [Tetrahymena thermophila]8TID_C Chain C, LRRC48 protein [Tetrahymena thermophila]|eukprot:XP_001021329.2 LRRC48 protein [Tetrahymena thermophila SB210]
MSNYISNYVQSTIVTKTVQNKDKKTGKNSVDPRVINEQLILDAVKQFNQENNKITTENIILQQLRQLQLSFKNILKIQHLQGLERLEKLQLDNNIIEKIENIDHLVNLKWLDLSFNCIKKIEGLDKLKELTDLSLFNNYIEKIEGLHNNTKLNVFSIGNNRLKSYEEITLYFGYKPRGEEGTNDRPEFKRLQVLNVSGNPFTKDKENEYKNHIICAIPNLKYLDYVFIDEGDRQLIRQDEQISNSYNFTTTDYYQQMQAQEQKEEMDRQTLKKKKDARMDILDNLKDEYLKIEDLQRVKIIKPNQINEEIEKYCGKINDHVVEMQAAVIQKHQLILQEMSKTEVSYKEQEALHEKETLQILKEFEHEKKVEFRNWEKEAANGDAKKEESRLKTLLQKTTSLKNKLMDIEIQLVEELEAIFTDYDTKKKETAWKDIEEIIVLGQKKIEEENVKFYSNLNVIKNKEEANYNSTQQQQLEEENNEEDDEKASLLENKEQLAQMIGNIKETLIDSHTKIILSAQMELQKDLAEYAKQQKNKMYERNRKNISQIIAQIDAYQTEINEKLKQGDDESDHEN